MNIDHLKLFVRIASLNNISQAGKEFSLSPAVASSHVNKLEESLGVRLIHRTTRKVSLTQEGEAFLPHALDILETIESAQAAIGTGNIRPKGKLRVTAPASFGRMHIIPFLKQFMARYPDLTIDLHLSDTISDLVEGGFDVAIRDAVLNDSTLIARKLAPVRRIVCASPEYIKKNGRPKCPHDLLNHDSVNFVGLDTWSFGKGKEEVSVKPKEVLRLDNGEAARDAAISGIGITLSSLWCCYEQIQKGELVEVLPDYPLNSTTSIWAIYPSSRLLAPKVRIFIDYFLECYKENTHWFR